MAVRLKILALAAVYLMAGTISFAHSPKEYEALADSLARAENRTGAIEVCREATAEYQQKYGADDTLVASWLNRLGVYYYQDASYDSAETVWRRSLRISEEKLGNDHPNVAKTLNNLAILFRDRGKYELAEPLYRRAMTIWEHAYGPDHALVATAANNLGYCYQSLGRYVEAERLYERGLEGWTRAYGPVHADVARAMINLASLYQDLGQLAKAEERLREALKVMDQVYPNGSPDVAYCLNNLALLCSKQARSGEAERLYQRALAMYENTLGPEHPYLTYSLDGLAMIAWERGDFETAELRMQRALAIHKKAYGDENPAVAQLENDLAIMYVDWGRIDLASPLETHALAVRTKVFGERHSDVAQSLLNLAEVRRRSGEIDEAMTLCQRALAIYKSCYGPLHDNVAAGLELAAELNYEMGHYDMALANATQGCSIRLRNFQANGAALSEDDALAFSGRLHTSLDYVLTCYRRVPAKSDSVTTALAELILRTKGQISDQVFQQNQWSRKGDDSTVAAAREQLRQSKYRLSELCVRGPSSDLADYQRRIDTLESSIAVQEANLARQSFQFQNTRDLDEITPRKAQVSLPPNAALVEYLRYEDHQWPGNDCQSRYIALIITKSGPTRIVDLGEGLVIDEVAGRYRANMIDAARQGLPLPQSAEAAYRTIAAGLASLVWKPVESVIRGANRVFVACDGSLNQVSFAGLPSGTSQYLIDRFAFHYLCSGRDLVRRKEETQPSGGLLALGDPNYFAQPLGVNAEPEATGNLTAERHLVLRGGTDCFALEDLVASPLPGSRREIAMVVDIWRATRKEAATVLTGADANELNLKRLAPKASYLHLATHGYFLRDTCDRSHGTRGGPKGRRGMNRNPLLLSGLLLAGANNRDTLTPGSDGVLTAYEVSEMDLDKTQLVVLSACESGLGESVEGEGIYGLRRAFQMAGARTVVSALWPISDSTTADLMGAFYGSSHALVPDRLRELALNHLGRLRAQHISTHPYTWAGFIAIGDWR